MEIIKAKEFGQLAQSAIEKCKTGPQMNLILNLETRLPAASDIFLSTYIDDAVKWQATAAPADFHFTHGQYLNRVQDAITYLAESIRNKATGNRACVTLANSDEIMGSRDGKLPSFMLIQAGRDMLVSNVLYLTAYYRALEVNNFLPINLAELAIIADGIAKEVDGFDSLHLVIHAFRGHSSPYGSSLKRSKLDICSLETIQQSVSSSNFAEIIEWLLDFDRTNTILECKGLPSLADEVSSSVLAGGKWPKSFTDHLNRAVQLEGELEQMRKRGTHGRGVQSKHDDLSKSLRSAVVSLRSMDK